MVNGQTGEVSDGLTVVDQQADQQCGTAVVDVDSPKHVTGYLQDVADELQQLGLVVKTRRDGRRVPSALITTQW